MNLTNLRGEYWGVEPPEGTGTYTFRSSEHCDSTVSFYDKFTNKETICVLGGTWQIICLSGECGEEVAKEIVVGYGGYYMDYTCSEEERAFCGCVTSVESLHSLLRSKGLNAKNTLILKKQ